MRKKADRGSKTSDDRLTAGNGKRLESELQRKSDPKTDIEVARTKKILLALRFR
jgi:hypothetical protein